LYQAQVVPGSFILLPSRMHPPFFEVFLKEQRQLDQPSVVRKLTIRTNFVGRFIWLSGRRSPKRLD
jgi:hypothetical protein